MRIINCSWHKPKNSQFFTFDFRPWQNIYTFYRRLNNNPIYIDKSLNHPPTILKQLPKSIAKRISETSSNEEILNKSIKIHSKALKQHGFTNEHKYLPNELQQPEKKKKEENAKRRSSSSIHSIQKTLLKKHFPTSHILHKIFDNNTVKISYSCMKNINFVISSNNKSLLNPRTTSLGHDCQRKEICPLSGECFTSTSTATNTVNEEIKNTSARLTLPLKKDMASTREILNTGNTPIK